MIVFPAIDLVAGKVVRLERGDRSRMKVYSENPAEVARDFVEQGATWLHVVDLSAAFEEDEAAREANSKAIAALCQVEGISIDVGGGVRSLEFAVGADGLFDVPWAPCSCETSRSPRQRRPSSGSCLWPMWPPRPVR